MYCEYCGSKLKENAFFCGKCGREVKPKVIYEEEQPLQSLASNEVCVALTLGIFILALVSIIAISVITQDYPVTNQLSNYVSYIFY